MHKNRWMETHLKLVNLLNRNLILNIFTFVGFFSESFLFPEGLDKHTVTHIHTWKPPNATTALLILSWTRPKWFKLFPKSIVPQLQVIFHDQLVFENYSVDVFHPDQYLTKPHFQPLGGAAPLFVYHKYCTYFTCDSSIGVLAGLWILGIKLNWHWGGWWFRGGLGVQQQLFAPGPPNVLIWLCMDPQRKVEFWLISNRAALYLNLMCLLILSKWTLVDFVCGVKAKQTNHTTARENSKHNLLLNQPADRELSRNQSVCEISSGNHGNQVGISPDQKVKRS